MSVDPEVAKALKVGDVEKLRMRMVQTADAAFQHMPAWPTAARGRWLRFTGAELSTKFGEVDMSAGVFPPLLDLLDQARPTLAGASTRNSAVVAVPAAAAFAAFPSSSPRKLIAMGVDPEKLTGEVLLEVHVDAEGRIESVRVEADALFDQAYVLAGIPATVDLASSVEARITLSGYGTPARVSVPNQADVMTEEQFADLFD